MGGEAEKLLEWSLPKTTSSLLHPSLQPSSTSYTLVTPKEEPDCSSPDIEDEDDFFSAEHLGEQMDYGDTSGDEESMNLKQRLKKKKEKKTRNGKSKKHEVSVVKEEPAWETPVT